MGTANKNGFTIIETMLFLAITGLMILGVLVSTGSSINAQRYRDSVATLKSFLQQQYTEAANVRNQNTTTNLSCDSNAAVTTTGGDARPRGQGDCVIMGRYIVIESSSIVSSTVVGYGEPNPSVSDVTNLKNYKLSLLPDSTETREMEWSTSIAWPRSGPESRGANNVPRTLAILILKSPVSGSTFTFTSDSRLSDLTSMIVAGNSVPGQAARTVCVESNGLFNGGLSVYISSMSSGNNILQVRSNDTETTVQC